MHDLQPALDARPAEAVGDVGKPVLVQGAGQPHGRRHGQRRGDQRRHADGAGDDKDDPAGDADKQADDREEAGGAPEIRPDIGIDAEPAGRHAGQEGERRLQVADKRIGVRKRVRLAHGPRDSSLATGSAVVIEPCRDRANGGPDNSSFSAALRPE